MNPAADFVSLDQLLQRTREEAAGAPESTDDEAGEARADPARDSDGVDDDTLMQAVEEILCQVKSLVKSVDAVNIVVLMTLSKISGKRLQALVKAVNKLRDVVTQSSLSAVMATAPRRSKKTTK
ncbi:late transcription factor VLTF-4 [Nile crocodilepox virus]|uniref:Late transcription factor VLTF-4 n=1 Tax=Nile crocodilepox virus (isolate Crocodylus niloticus/Zimbabwe/Ume/2001) TaxID=1289473 RepID=Q070E6_CPRVZ|nr:late transcription factor VLTF-4 [Nile crocodilepox virus]ABJ08996.1 late transcription factor VLTF-4 [Nile crocodilepox virus]